MKPRAQYMSEEEFWHIIEDAKMHSSNNSELAKYIIDLLEARNIESILGFDYWFSKFHYGSYNGDLWCTAYVAMGGCSDDAFDYFRAWLISQGKEVFEAAMSDPDSLVSALENTGRDAPENEILLVASARAYETKTGKDIKAFYKVLDEYETDFGSFAQPQFNWSQEDEESMKKICPKVFERFW